ncbi:hypothetical protein MTR67_006993 [Solanum verrucosum]|uniref:Tf2-1-like SH3-like domain-containing protein n=1 Tax=Solanum verrucosum TaxID=315347 RepID=A0AAF0PZC9_SOLVR|nr:hypothetical protein MTR67_006993 [Solanum verrucosum]
MVAEWVFLQLSPMKSVMRFGRKGKLSPRFIIPFEILRRTREVAYELALPSSLLGVHHVFHVSMLRCYAPKSLTCFTGIHFNLISHWNLRRSMWYSRKSPKTPPLNGPRQGPRPTFTDRESAPWAVVLPVVLEAVAPLSCTSQNLAKARPRSLPRSVVMTTVRGDGLGHDFALWRQGLQALVPSDVHEPPLSLVKCTTARSGARGALGSSYPNNPQLPKT